MLPFNVLHHSFAGLGTFPSGELWFLPVEPLTALAYRLAWRGVVWQPVVAIAEK